MKRSWMEDMNWLQGSIVSSEDTVTIINGDAELPEDTVLVVASQSCDIASNNEEGVEFSIAREIAISDVNGLYQHNKHPRILQIPVESRSPETGAITESYLHLLAQDKVIISKERLLELGVANPSEFKVIAPNYVLNYIDWLAARYKRPALPTAFDRRVEKAWKQKPRENSFSRLGGYIKGVHCKFHEYKELAEDEIYNIELLIIITEDALIDVNPDIYCQIHKLVETFKTKLEKQKINVIVSTIEPEKNVSIQTFNTFKRINFDKLSYQSGDDNTFPSDLLRLEKMVK